MAGIDWLICWRFYHNAFFLIYLLTSLPTGAFLSLKLRSHRTKRLWIALLFAFGTAAVNTWLPLIPIAGGGALALLGSAELAQSKSLGLPVVAICMAIEASLLQFALIRFVAKNDRLSFLQVFASNLTSAPFALVFALIWILRHPVQMLA